MYIYTYTPTGIRIFALLETLKDYPCKTKQSRKLENMALISQLNPKKSMQEEQPVLSTANPHLLVHTCLHAHNRRLGSRDLVEGLPVI